MALKSSLILFPMLLQAITGAPGQDTPSTFFAGAAKEEITPPPGFPTGGHGPAGDMARGYWNRLYARAFYIGDLQGHGLILVSCDMFAFPLGLNAEVWKAVRNTASSRGVGPGNMILAATHTHHGPGNYLTAQVYNEFGSRE